MIYHDVQILNELQVPINYTVRYFFIQLVPVTSEGRVEAASSGECHGRNIFIVEE